MYWCLDGFMRGQFDLLKKILTGLQFLSTTTRNNEIPQKWIFKGISWIGTAQFHVHLATKHATERNLRFNWNTGTKHVNLKLALSR